MITTIISLSKRFYFYQKLRFPVVILSLSLLPAILSSGTIVTANPPVFQVAGVLITSILYLLHIRVIDEYRDFSHDNIHHNLRPVQTGHISIKELQIIDIYAMVIFLAIAIFAGIYSFFVGVFMLIYSYLASKDFFIGEKLRQHFFIYNGINIIQMFLLQFFAYTIFAGSISFTTLLILHYIFTCIGSIIFEFVRKLKIPGTDGTGKDTYTWYLGFNNAIIVYLIFVLLNTVFFYQIMIIITGQNTLWLFFSFVLFCISLLFALVHLIKKATHTEQLMQLSFLIVYAIFNLVIYFVKLH